VGEGGGGGRDRIGGVEGAGNDAAMGEDELVKGVDVEGGSTRWRALAIGGAIGQGQAGGIRPRRARGEAKECECVNRRAASKERGAHNGWVAQFKLTLLFAVGEVDGAPHLDFSNLSALDGIHRCAMGVNDKAAVGSAGIDGA